MGYVTPSIVCEDPTGPYVSWSSLTQLIGDWEGAGGREGGLCIRSHVNSCSCTCVHMLPMSVSRNIIGSVVVLGFLR